MNHTKNRLFCNFMFSNLFQISLNFKLVLGHKVFQNVGQVVTTTNLNIRCRSLACHIRYADHTINSKDVSVQLVQRPSAWKYDEMFAPNIYTTLFELQTLACDNYLTVLGSTLCTLTDYKQESYVLMFSQLIFPRFLVLITPRALKKKTAQLIQQCYKEHR